MKLKAPKDAGTHISFNGELYAVKKGIVEVPDNATELFAHGYTEVIDAPEGGKKGKGKTDEAGEPGKAADETGGGEPVTSEE